jgi:hypothetical protein
MPGGQIGTGSAPLVIWPFELEVAAEATAAAITRVANIRRSDFFTVVLLCGLRSNPYYLRNTVTGYFRHGTIAIGAEFENSYFCGRLWKSKKPALAPCLKKQLRRLSEKPTIHSESEPDVLKSD